MPSKRKASPSSKTQGARSATNGSNPSQTLTLVLRPPAALQKKLATLGHSPIEPLSYSTYRELYGTPDKELQVVEDWAASAQLQLVETGWREKAKLSGVVRLAGDPQAISSQLRLKQDATTRALRLQAPTALEGLVAWAFGIQPQVVAALETAAAPPSPAHWGQHTALRRYAYQETTRKAQAVANQDLSPLKVAAAYNYPSNQGAGQCLGLIELQGVYQPEDIQQYLLSQGVRTKPQIEDVMLGHPVSGDWSDVEVTMNVELAASLCPEAKLVVYNACSRDYSLEDFFRVFAAAVFDTKNRPSVLSCSWAFPECVEGVNARLDPSFSISKEEEVVFNQLFMKAALLGITICAASGDSGSLISFPSKFSPTMATALPITFFPASSPFVLGCGGTQSASKQAPLQEEVVWNQLSEVLLIGSGKTAVPSGGGSSGGGVSLLNPLPPYQERCSVPETVLATMDDGIYTVLKRQRGRGVPDVAAFSHLSPGYCLIYKGAAAMGGGTSAATPMWAALVTRINTALGKRVGFLHPSLYQYQFERKSLFKTIQYGGNGAYRASQELWNPCTGLGTPDGVEIVNALKKAAS